MRDTLYRERQLWSGNESVEIRYVSGSSVAGTSASSPGVPRHISILYISIYLLQVPGEEEGAGGGISEPEDEEDEGDEDVQVQKKFEIYLKKMQFFLS